MKSVKRIIQLINNLLFASGLSLLVISCSPEGVFALF